MKRLFAVAAAAVCLPASAEAAITIDVVQQGSSVVVTGSGSFDTTGLKVYSSGAFGQPVVNAADGIVTVGQAASITIFQGLTGPSLGTLQGPKRASSSTGDVFGFSRYLNAVYVPVGYRSGAQLAGTATYLNTTFAALGLSAGQFVFRTATDSVTLNVGVAAVPEPASWAMMLAGFGAMAFALRSARRKVAVRFG